MAHRFNYESHSCRSRYGACKKGEYIKFKPDDISSGLSSMFKIKELKVGSFLSAMTFLTSNHYLWGLKSK